MISANPNGDFPQIDVGAVVDPTARIIGNVHIAAGCYVGPYAIIRADEVAADGKVAPVCIGEESNIQDAVIIHALAGTKVTIGRRCSISHGSVVHGPCTVGDGSFVGFKAVVYASTLGSEVFVGISAVVQEVVIPQGGLVAASAAILSENDVTRSVGKITSRERTFMGNVIKANMSLVKGYNSL
ncbi:MAG: carbonate dehydratase [Phycisphaerae bacterium]|nr:carbonate dehydratase [Phycisphaerae bacterium]